MKHNQSPPEQKASKKREGAVAATPTQEQSLVRIRPSVTKCDEKLHASCEFGIETPNIKLEIFGVITWELV